MQQTIEKMVQKARKASTAGESERRGEYYVRANSTQQRFYKQSLVPLKPLILSMKEHDSLKKIRMLRIKIRQQVFFGKIPIKNRKEEAR